MHHVDVGPPFPYGGLPGLLHRLLGQRTVEEVVEHTNLEQVPGGADDRLVLGRRELVWC